MADEQHARLLLAIVERRWTDAERLAPVAVGDPAGFVALCRQCDVPTWVHALLAGGGREHLAGAEALRQLAAIRSKVQRDNLLLLSLAERALDTLSAAGIVPVALKGLDLLHRVYARFDERTLDDIDLLVAPHELPAALAALEAAGWRAPAEPQRTHYVRSSHHLPLLAPAPVKVELELHWNLVQERRYRVDGGALLERAVPTVISGRRLLRLEDHDAVAHLLLHHFTHYFDRKLKWAVDLHALAGRPDFHWALVAGRIREWGATAACAMSLEHLAKLVPSWIPPEIRARLPVAAWRRGLTLPLRSGHPLELFRARQRRAVQLFLASALLERPALLPAWVVHRVLRDRRRGSHPLDRDGTHPTHDSASGRKTAAR